MRLLVTGPRAFNDQERLFDALHALKPCVLIHGFADGADMLVHEWAITRAGYPIEVHVKPYPNHLGRAGGPLRNQYLIEQYAPDLVLACRTNGPDAGTRDCMARAIEHGIPVVQLWDRMYEK